MNEPEREELIEGYLGRLGKALDGAPSAARRELLEDVRGHIAEAWAAEPQQDRAALLNILERLGPPEALAREQLERLGVPQAEGRADVLAPIAVVLTALFWPIGIVLAWISTRWRTRDKVVATALPILGLAVLLALSVPAYMAFQSAPVVTRQIETLVDGGSPGTVPLVASSSHSNLLISLLGGALSLCGLLGAPLAAAIYLAWRLRRPVHGPGAPVSLAVAALLFFSSVLALLFTTAAAL